MPELDTEELERLVAHTRVIANICERHGFADGNTAARSQQRALEKELAARRA